MPRSRVTRFGEFLPIWLLLEARYDFFKFVAQRKGNIFAHIMLKKIYYIFAIIGSFTTRFNIGMLRFEK